MARNVPVAGGVLSLIGAIFILLGGIAMAVLGAILSVFLPSLAGLFAIGLVIGVIALIVSILIFVMPHMKTAWGALMIVLAVVSLPFNILGGFVIGFILALIGGILTLVWKPPMVAPMGAPMAPPMGAPGAMTCPACGGMVNMQTRTCMSCGRQV